MLPWADHAQSRTCFEHPWHDLSMIDPAGNSSALCPVQVANGHKHRPAQVRCFDTARIHVQAGAGGRGSVAFRREANVPKGEPWQAEPTPCHA